MADGSVNTYVADQPWTAVVYFMDGQHTVTLLASDIHHETAGARIRFSETSSEFIPWHRIDRIVKQRVPAVAWPAPVEKEAA